MDNTIQKKLVIRTIILIVCLLVTFLILGFYSLAFLGLSMFTGGSGSFDDVLTVAVLLFLIIAAVPVVLMVSAWRRKKNGEVDKAGKRSLIAMIIGAIPAVLLSIVLFFTIFRFGPAPGDYPLREPTEADIEVMREELKAPPEDYDWDAENSDINSSIDEM